jgi:hypothetical protein
MQYREPLSRPAPLAATDGATTARLLLANPQVIPELEGGPDETSPHPVLGYPGCGRIRGYGPRRLQQQQRQQ